VSPRVPQAGGIVVRKDGDRLSVLLVRSKKDPTIWVFPKGHIDPGETAEQTALRETYEEAGVEGELVAPVGAPLEFQSGQETVSVQYFLIRAQSECASPERRDKQWLSIDEALTTLAFESARDKLREARAALDRQMHGT
jgi:8-oxo-dGTP pyrophosphatase MutT (NUDIX family)